MNFKDKNRRGNLLTQLNIEGMAVQTGNMPVKKMDMRVNWVKKECLWVLVRWQRYYELCRCSSACLLSKETDLRQVLNASIQKNKKRNLLLYCFPAKNHAIYNWCQAQWELDWRPLWNCVHDCITFFFPRLPSDADTCSFLVLFVMAEMIPNCTEREKRGFKRKHAIDELFYLVSHLRSPCISITVPRVTDLCVSDFSPKKNTNRTSCSYKPNGEVEIQHDTRVTWKCYWE